MSSSRRRRRKRWSGRAPKGMLAVAVAALAVVAVGLSWAALSMPERVEANQDRTPRPIPTFTQPSATPTTEPEAVAFLGDSYSPPMGVEPPASNFAMVVAAERGWNVLPFGQGGTGYTNPGQPDEGDDVYSARVDDVIAAEPDIVIVQGSGNDGRNEGTYDAALDVLTRLRDALPEATIITIGPCENLLYGEAEYGAARDAVREASANLNIPFIDPIAERWMERNPDYFVDDQIHLNPAGYAEMARRLSESLDTLL